MMSDFQSELGEQLESVVFKLSEEMDRDGEEIMLYVEAERAWIYASAFKELPDHLVYYVPSYELTTEILDIWYAAAEDKKWRAFLMIIEGDRFDVKFHYWDQPDDQEDVAELDRRAIHLSERYGDKRVDYGADAIGSTVAEPDDAEP